MNYQIWNCPICITDIKNSLFITHCGHKYHKKCIKQWLQKKPNCPTCRSIIYYNNPSTQNLQFFGYDSSGQVEYIRN